MNLDGHNLPGVQLIDAAVEIARSLETRECDEIVAAAAVNYAALGLLDDALASVREISDSYLADTAIAQTAVNVITCEPETDVLSLVESIEDPGIHNLALEQVSVKYAEVNLFDTALEISRRLEDQDSALARIIPLISTIANPAGNGGTIPWACEGTGLPGKTDAGENSNLATLTFLGLCNRDLKQPALCLVH